MEGSIDEVELVIVPVAHVSKRSAALAHKAILETAPDVIGLELCRERLASIAQGKGKADFMMLLSHPTSFLMFIAQQLIGRAWKVRPGLEMIYALRASAKVGKPVILLDRPIRAIAKDIEKIPLREKLGLLFWGNPLEKNLTLNELMEPQNLSSLLLRMKEDFPVSYSVFVESRNRHMFRSLLARNPASAVIVVGAAHVPGIAALARDSDRKINVRIAK